MSDGFVDVVQNQPVTAAQNFSIPGAAATVFVRFRGVWAVGLVYNVNEMVRYTGGNQNLLLLCVQTHVAPAVWDASKWTTLVDLGALGSEGATPEQINDAIANAQAAANTAIATQTIIASLYAQVQAAANGVGNTASDVNSALALAVLIASASPGVAVPAPDGSTIMSAYAAAILAAQNAKVAIPTPTQKIDDISPAAIDLGPSHIAKLTRVNRSAADVTVTLKPNVFSDKAADGSEGASFARFVVESGSVNKLIISAGGVAALDPAVTAVSPIVEKLPSPFPTGNTTRNVSLQVPAGTGRYVTVPGFASYNAADASRNTQMSCTQAAAVAEVNSDTSLAGYTDSGGVKTLDAFQYRVDMADSDTPTNITLAFTFSKLLQSYVIQPVCVTRSSGMLAGSAVADGSTADATTATETLTSAEAKDVAIFGFAQQNINGVPVTLNRGTQISTGRTSPSGSYKDITFIFGYEIHAAAGGVAYTASFAAGNPTARTGILMKPVAGTVAVDVNGPGMPLTVNPKEQVLIEPLSDGKTYYVKKF